jgi:hypothetical protein
MRELGSLNSVKYLFLRELTKPRNNSLRLVVQEAVVAAYAVPELKQFAPESHTPSLMQ